MSFIDLKLILGALFELFAVLNVPAETTEELILCPNALQHFGPAWHDVDAFAVELAVLELASVKISISIPPGSNPVGFVF